MCANLNCHNTPAIWQEIKSSFWICEDCAEKENAAAERQGFSVGCHLMGSRDHVPHKIRKLVWEGNEAKVHEFKSSLDARTPFGLYRIWRWRVDDFQKPIPDYYGGHFTTIQEDELISYSLPTKNPNLEWAKEECQLDFDRRAQEIINQLIEP